MSLFEIQKNTHYASTAGWANDVFSEIKNMDFTNPPIDNGFTSEWQFLQKRKWFRELAQFWWNIIDYFSINEIFYLLIQSTATECLIKKLEKDIDWAYTVETTLGSSILFNSSYRRWSIPLVFPSGTPLVENAECDNVAASTTELTTANANFDSSYIWAYVVITSHNEDNVENTIDFTTVEPRTPLVWDRYINTTTGNSSSTTQAMITNYIYEWNGVDWTETVVRTWFFVIRDWANDTLQYDGISWNTTTSLLWFKEDIFFEVLDVKSNDTLSISSPVSLENNDSYTVYPALSTYQVFKRSWDDDTWKYWVNILDDTIRYFENLKWYNDLCMFDGALFVTDWTNIQKKPIWQTAASYYDQLYPLYNTDILSLEPAGEFIVVWWEDSIHAISRVIQTDSWEYIYRLRDVENQWLLSQESILSHWGSLYVILQDKHWYALNIQFEDNAVVTKLVDSWFKVQRTYLDALNDDDIIEWYYHWGSFWFTVNGSSNQVIKYNENMQCYTLYEFVNAYSNMQSIRWDLHCVDSTSLLVQEWNNDNWDDISQKLVMIWPPWSFGTQIRLFWLRVVIWYKDTELLWNIEVETDNGIFKEKFNKDIETTQYVDMMNMAAQWALWDWVLWWSVLWGWDVLSEDLARIWVLWVWVWKIWHYFKVTITNEWNTDFVFGSMDMLYNIWDPRLINIKNKI